MSPILGIFASQNYPRSTTAFESIATTTVGSGGASSVTFTDGGAWTGYTHLQLRGINLISANSFVKVQFNSDTGSNYATHALQGNGSNVSVFPYTNYTQIFLNLFGSSTTYPTPFIFDILDFKNTNKYKTTRALYGIDTNGGSLTHIDYDSGLWMNTNAITSITLTASASGAFQQYSQIALYGIKA